jgi:hypothetical protein
MKMPYESLRRFPFVVAVLLAISCSGNSGSENEPVGPPEVPSSMSLYLGPDHLLTYSALSEPSLFQQRISASSREWKSDKVITLNGTEYVLSLVAGSYEQIDVQVALLLETTEQEVTLVSTTFAITSSSLMRYDATVRGPDPKELPHGSGSLVLRMTTAGTVWVEMGPPPDKASYLIVPAR